MRIGARRGQPVSILTLDKVTCKYERIVKGANLLTCKYERIVKGVNL